MLVEFVLVKFDVAALDREREPDEHFLRMAGAVPEPIHYEGGGPGVRFVACVPSGRAAVAAEACGCSIQVCQGPEDVPDALFYDKRSYVKSDSFMCGVGTFRLHTKQSAA